MAHACTLRACVHVSLQGTAGLLRRRLAGTRTTCLLLKQVRGKAARELGLWGRNSPPGLAISPNHLALRM